MKSWRHSMFYGLKERMTDEQESYLDSIEKNRLTITNSVSGSGKTTLAVAFAHLNQMKLIYLFSPVEEHQMGFRPGEQEEKEEAYLGPLKDALKKIKVDYSSAIFKEQYGTKESFLNKNAWIEAKSHIFLRGTNIGEEGETLVIIDEAQNWTKLELKKTLTRIHDKAKVVVMGHTEQCDLPDPSASGFPRLIEHFTPKHYAELITLSKNFRGELSRDADYM